MGFLESVPERVLLDACRAAPIFPLPEVVFIPNTMLPLHVFEERYRNLVRDSLAGDRILVVPTLAPGWQADRSDTPPVNEIAGIGKIVKVQELSDGRFNIILAGLCRVRLGQEHPLSNGYRRVVADVLHRKRPKEGDEAMARRLGHLQMLFGQLLMNSPTPDHRLGQLVENEPTLALVDVLANLLIREPKDRQAYLEVNAYWDCAEVVMDVLSEMLAHMHEPTGNN